MEKRREFFPCVKKTIMPRPADQIESDVLGQGGSAWATQAAIYGPNWYHDQFEGLIEIYDAGPAICFKHLLPKKDKYTREGLYLRLGIAYRTTKNANVNIRTFSGNHVTLPNSLEGTMYWDPYTYYWVTDDMTLNINTIYAEEKIWIQRVDWEWVSKEVVYEDELGEKDQYLHRTEKDVVHLYTPQEITHDKAKEYLMNRIKEDDHFAKRCFALLRSDQLLKEDLVSLFEKIKDH